MSGLKKYLEIKEILNEDEELREEFESLWERFLIGFYNFNKNDFNILIEDFVSFYEFLVKLPELPRIKDPDNLEDITLKRGRG